MYLCATPPNCTWKVRWLSYSCSFPPPCPHLPSPSSLPLLPPSHTIPRTFSVRSPSQLPWRKPWRETHLRLCSSYPVPALVCANDVLSILINICLTGRLLGRDKQIKLGKKAEKAGVAQIRESLFPQPFLGPLSLPKLHRPKAAVAVVTGGEVREGAGGVDQACGGWHTPRKLKPLEKVL